MKYNYFKVEIENKISRVSFNRPEKSNALNMEAWVEMRSVFESLSSNKEVRVVILSGEGKHFCAGIDLELLMSINEFRKISCLGRQSEKVRELIVTLQETVTSIEKCAKPVLATIHNGCIGGGVDIATACDIRYCTEDAYFSIKEIDLGMVADLGTLQRLPRIISPGMAAELAYTSRDVHGSEAKEIGLVNQCFATKELLMKGVMEIATTIADKSPLAVRGTKNVLNHSRENSVEDGLNYVSTWNAAMLLSDDLTEAFNAKKENRLPTFED